MMHGHTNIKLSLTVWLQSTS